MPDRRNLAHDKKNKKKQVSTSKKINLSKNNLSLSKKTYQVVFTEDGRIFVRQDGFLLSPEAAGL